MVIFDKNGMLIAQKINHKGLHKEIDEQLYELPPIERKLSNEKYDDLLKFLHNYIQKHGFVGQKMVSGLYITKCNPKHNFDTIQDFERAIKRRVSMIFNVYIKLGICKKHGKNAVKINGNKLKEFSLNDIRDYAYRN